MNKANIGRPVIKFIELNTSSVNSLTALLRASVISLSLCIGLFSLDLGTLPFYKSLFVYSTALTLDFGVRYVTAERDKQVGLWLYFCYATLAFTAFLLAILSMLHIFESPYKMEFMTKSAFFFVALIILQAVYYFVEFFFLFIKGLFVKIMGDDYHDVNISSILD